MKKLKELLAARRHKYKIYIRLIDFSQDPERISTLKPENLKLNLIKFCYPNNICISIIQHRYLKDRYLLELETTNQGYKYFLTFLALLPLSKYVEQISKKGFY